MVRCGSPFRCIVRSLCRDVYRQNTVICAKIHPECCCCGSSGGDDGSDGGGGDDVLFCFVLFCLFVCLFVCLLLLLFFCFFLGGGVGGLFCLFVPFRFFFAYDFYVWYRNRALCVDLLCFA